jgi:hypothetical protein
MLASGGRFGQPILLTVVHLLVIGSGYRRNEVVEVGYLRVHTYVQNL